MMSRILLVPAGLVAAAALVELAMRAWIRLDRRWFVSVPGSRREYRLDPEALPQLPPVAEVRFNRDGERGSEPSDAEGTFRVLVAGGSAAQSLLVDQPWTWPVIMQKVLSQPQAKDLLECDAVHVGSIGKSGMHSGDVRLILDRTLPRYRKLDAIVLFMGASDIIRWMAADTPVDQVPITIVDECFDQHPDVALGFTPRRSGTAEVVRRLRARWVIERRERVGRWLTRARARRAAATEMRDTIVDPGHVLDFFEANLSAVIELAKRKATHVLVVQQPWLHTDRFMAGDESMFWNFGVGELTEGRGTIFYSSPVVNQLLRQFSERATLVSTRAGVGNLDLLPVLPPSPTYFYDRMHFTAEGNRVVAHAVAEALLRQVNATHIQSSQAPANLLHQAS
jgi:hypothetical protein